MANSTEEKDPEWAVSEVGHGISRTHSAVHASFALNGLFILALLAVLTLGREVFLPLATAFLLSFVFRPVVRALQGMRIPPPVTGFLLVVLLGTGLTSAIYSFKEPASTWLKEAPHSLRELKYRIRALQQPIADVTAATEALDDLRKGSGSGPKEVVVKERAINDVLLVEASETLIAVFMTLVVLFFILGWGDRLFRNIVIALPGFRERREVVVVVREIEKSITVYLATITMINLVLGAVVAIVLHLLGLPNAILWGVVAGILNFIPYLGPAITALLLAFTALITFNSIGEAVLIPLAFLLINGIEANIVTPFAVGRQLTLNPLLIFLSLMLWFWMWGIIGALLTVPILVCIKAILDRTQGTSSTALAHILD